MICDDTDIRALTFILTRIGSLSLSRVEVPKYILDLIATLDAATCFIATDMAVMVNTKATTLHFILLHA